MARQSWSARPEVAAARVPVPSMTTATQAPVHPNRPLAPPDLRPARFDDFAQVQQLECKHNMVSPPQAQWRDMWLTNPLWARVQKDWPLGWVLESSNNQIVGALWNLPSAYHFQGRELI